MRDADGNPVLDGDGNKTYTVKEYTVPVTDSTEIFQSIESIFRISISESEREYVINPSQVLMDYSPSTVSEQVIALVGSIGESTGNHCHFEICVNRKAVDPMGFLK